MKVLAVVCLLVALGLATAKEQHHKSKSHLAKSHHSKQKSHFQHLVRANEPNQTCSLVCEPATGGGDSWVISIDTSVYLIYNAENHYLGVVNINQGTIVVWYESTQILVVVCIRTGAAILIKGDFVLYVSGSGEIDVSGQEQVYAALVFIYEKIVVVNEGNVSGSESFSLTLLLEFLLTGTDVTVAAFLEGRAELAAALQESFSVVFVQINKALRGGIISVTGGLAVFFSVAFEVSSNVAYVAYYRIFYTIVYYHAKLDAAIVNFIYENIISGTSITIDASAGLIESVGLLFATLEDARAALQAGYFKFASASTGSGSRTLQVAFLSNINTRDWVIRLTSARVSVYIVYYAKVNLLTFYNVGLQIAMSFPGKGTSYGLFNLTSGAGIAIDKLAGRARPITTSSNQIADLYAQGNFMASFKLIGDVLSKIQLGLLAKNVFQFGSWLSAIRKNGADWKKPLLMSKSIEATLRASFSGVAEAFEGIKGYNMIWGSANVLLLFVGQFNIGFFANQVIELIFTITTKLSGLFNAVVMGQFFSWVEISVSLEWKSGSLLEFIKGGGGTSTATESSWSSSWTSSWSSSYNYTIPGSVSYWTETVKTT